MCLRVRFHPKNCNVNHHDAYICIYIRFERGISLKRAIVQNSKTVFVEKSRKKKRTKFVKREKPKTPSESYFLICFWKQTLIIRLATYSQSRRVHRHSVPHSVFFKRNPVFSSYLQNKLLPFIWGAVYFTCVFKRLVFHFELDYTVITS